jgi:hypothetical protein
MDRKPEPDALAALAEIRAVLTVEQITKWMRHARAPLNGHEIPIDLQAVYLQAVILARLASLPADGVIVTPDSLARVPKPNLDKVIAEFVPASPTRDILEAVTVLRREHYRASAHDFLAPGQRRDCNVCALLDRPKRIRTDWSDVVVDEGDEAP